MNSVPVAPQPDLDRYATDTKRMVRKLWIYGALAAAVGFSAFASIYQLHGLTWMTSFLFALGVLGFFAMWVGSVFTRLWRKHIREELDVV